MSRTARLTMIAERYLKGIGGVPDEVRAIIQFNDSSRLNAIYLETRLRELAEKRAPMTGREMALAIMEKRFRTTADAEVALDRIIKRKFPRREFPVIPAKAEILVRGNRAYADACSGCGTGISPQNDAAAVYAWGLGEALLYGTVRPSHLFPVVDRGRTVCRGAPGWAKYFPGQPRVEGPYDFTTERILRRGYRAFLEFLRDNTLPMPGGRPDRIAGI
ncbi:MAG: hypothetical protein HYT77_09285 [Deltaproteobacteria bacterium]|nr:hypothetical protein [Deltaproteobacteria bacterium]